MGGGDEILKIVGFKIFFQTGEISAFRGPEPGGLLAERTGMGNNGGLQLGGYGFGIFLEQGQITVGSGAGQ